jgi:hypothetical protein
MPFTQVSSFTGQILVPLLRAALAFGSAAVKIL